MCTPYEAEPYHQDYAERDPLNPYILFNAPDGREGPQALEGVRQSPVANFPKPPRSLARISANLPSRVARIAPLVDRACVGARLVCARLHQRSAPLDARERFAERALAAAGRDLFVLVTCHRVECYTAAPADVAPSDWLSRRLGDTLPAVAIENDESAALQLFRVACGLDSAIPG